MAEGKSTRMVTDMTKVLHEICRPSDAGLRDRRVPGKAGITKIICVVGYPLGKVIAA